MKYAGRDRVGGSDPKSEPRDGAKRETMRKNKGRKPTDVETGQETAEKEKETRLDGRRWSDRGERSGASRRRWDEQLGQAVLGNSTASGGGSLLAHPHSHHPHLLCPLSLSSRLGREVGHTSSLGDSARRGIGGLGLAGIEHC